MSTTNISRQLGLSGRFHKLGRRLSVVATGLMVACVTAVPAFASDVNGNITNVAFVDNGRRVLFWTSGARTARPSCDCCNRWEVYVGDAYGQALMSIIMTAYASGRSINLGGTGTCLAGAGDTEGVSYLQTN